MNIKWDAEKYTDNFSFVHRHGTDVLKLIERKNGKVLDLGCGNGALTKVLHDKGYIVRSGRFGRYARCCTKE